MEKNERVKAEIRDMTKDLLLGVKGSDAAEIMPQPQRYGRQL